jgi:hypothetical protein
LLVSGNRNAGGVTFTLPDGWEIENTHFWLYFSSPDGKEHPGSVYGQGKILKNVKIK